MAMQAYLQSLAVAAAERERRAVEQANKAIKTAERRSRKERYRNRPKPGMIWLRAGQS